MDKNELRSSMMKKRGELSALEHCNLSNIIFNKVIHDERFLNAHHVGLYVSFKNEVDTLKLIDFCLSHGKRVSVPRVSGKTMDFYEIKNKDELKPGTFGVLEPTTGAITDKNSIDIIYVPLLAYDRSNHRVGYGKGYYDNYLNGYCNLTIGLAFSFQMVDSFVTNPFDFPLNFIYNEL
ncbi:MAG: 5-formyltetrahydrofolate cyclo-ligase [Erysipelotrichaceae bacterium]|nr:5-formyltetrahydrofolate cyclo-ligase [Erysipelotrichaceae bacterium]MDD3808670.1 5-formyltetrahydrofolate cyclo-ligase [Erysipelotrichaceae bacterium]